MSPEVKELLEDVLRNGVAIREFTREHAFESYRRDAKTDLEALLEDVNGLIE